MTEGHNKLLENVLQSMAQNNKGKIDQKVIEETKSAAKTRDNKDDTTLKILQKYDEKAKADNFNDAMKKNDVATIMDLVKNQGVEPCKVYVKPTVVLDGVDFSSALIPELQTLINDC